MQGCYQSLGRQTHQECNSIPRLQNFLKENPIFLQKYDFTIFFQNAVKFGM